MSTADEAVARPAVRRPRWPMVVAALLTFGAGAVDVAALTKLGGMFASVMTGNLALAGLGVARADAAALASAAAALGGYIGGVALGVQLTKPDVAAAGRWPVRVTLALGAELIVLAGFSLAWELVGAEPSAAVARGLLVVAAAAMGIQSAAMRALTVTIPTTFLTGTVTGIVSSVMTSRRVDGTALAAIVALLCGACVSGLLLRHAPAVLPLVTTLPLAVVVISATYRHRRGLGFE